MSNLKITVKKATRLKPKPPDHELVFGATFTDHMFVMDYEEGKGWYDPRIVPYTPIEVDPAMATLHYAQAVFEGLKAYRWADGTIAMFRPEKNMQRLNQGSARLCIPAVDEDFLLKAISQLVLLEKDWVPHKEGTSLYIRPFVFATEPILGVRPAKAYKLMVILSPVGPYYSSGFAPVKILAVDHLVRAAVGGTGCVKASGNYAASLLAAQEAKKAGYTQVLWLDACEHKYVEEVGTMNIVFHIGDEVITAPLAGSILNGVTRDSVLEQIKSWGIQTRERQISIDEVFEAAANGTLKEIFGTGTACVISSVGELKYKDRTWRMTEWKPGPLAQCLFDELTAIQYGKKPDPFGWVYKIVD